MLPGSVPQFGVLDHFARLSYIESTTSTYEVFGINVYQSTTNKTFPRHFAHQSLHDNVELGTEFAQACTYTSIFLTQIAGFERDGRSFVSTEDFGVVKAREEER